MQYNVKLQAALTAARNHCISAEFDYCMFLHLHFCVLVSLVRFLASDLFSYVLLWASRLCYILSAKHLLFCCVLQYERLGMTSHYKVFEDMFTSY